MSQHDMVIDNASGAGARTDINNALQALASTSKGNNAPSTPYAGQPWLDDNTPSSSKWADQVYDGTDWIKKGELDTTNNLYVGQVGGGTATIASNTTTDLGSSFEASITVSGTTTITGFGSSAPKGAFKLVTFSGILTLTYNVTSMLLPSAASIVTAAGDTALCEHLGSGNWKVHHYTRINGTCVGGGSFKVGSTTRDSSLASSTQDVTGLGFTPKAVTILASISTGSPMSTGFSDGTTNGCVADYNAIAASAYAPAALAVYSIQSGTANYSGTITMIADGFRITWAKTGATTGTITMHYKAER